MSRLVSEKLASLTLPARIYQLQRTRIHQGVNRHLGGARVSTAAVLVNVVFIDTPISLAQAGGMTILLATIYFLSEVNRKEPRISQKLN